VGDEARDTFQVSCNEFRSTIWEVCTGKNQFGTRMTCRGTHQGMPWHALGSPWLVMGHIKASRGMPWAAHGLSWHTARHAVASLGAPWAGHGTHQGMPWQPMACHGTHRGMAWLALAPHGQAMAHTKAFFEAILGVWTRYFAHMLRKIIPSSLPSFTFFGKN
jgi:hypothetical protein